MIKCRTCRSRYLLTPEEKWEHMKDKHTLIKDATSMDDVVKEFALDKYGDDKYGYLFNHLDDKDEVIEKMKKMMDYMAINVQELMQ